LGCFSTCRLPRRNIVGVVSDVITGAWPWSAKAVAEPSFSGLIGPAFVGQSRLWSFPTPILPSSDLALECRGLSTYLLRRACRPRRLREFAGRCGGEWVRIGNFDWWMFSKPMTLRGTQENGCFLSAQKMRFSSKNALFNEHKQSITYVSSEPLLPHVLIRVWQLHLPHEWTIIASFRPQPTEALARRKRGGGRGDAFRSP